MKCNFLNWYSQALGATLGIIACVYAYLKGYMLVYSNISGHFDFIGFNGVISSYLLLPLCICTLLFGIARPNLYYKEFINIPFKNLNIVIAIITVIIGFLGARIYFAIPAILILASFYSIRGNNEDILDTSEDNHRDKEADDVKSEENNKYMYTEQMLDEDKTSIYVTNLELKKTSLLNTKRDFVMDLLSKDSDIQFIVEITGFTEDEINEIKNSF